jgi:O-antigen ligase
VLKGVLETPELAAFEPTRKRRIGAVITVLGVVALCVLVGAALPAAVVAVVLVLAGIALCLGSPWHGTLLVIALTLLFPTPFALYVGGSTITIGRFFLFVLAAGWLVALRRPGTNIRFRRTKLDVPMVAVLGVLAASTALNAPLLDHYELVGMFRRTLVFGVDFFLLFWIVASVLDTRERAEKLLRFVALLVGVTAVFGVIEHFTGRNIFQYLAPVLPAHVNATINALSQASALYRGEARAHSTFAQPLSFGVVLGMGLPLAIAFALRERGSSRLGWVLVSGLDVLAMLFTFARSTLVLAASTLVTFMLFAPTRRMRITLALAVAVGGLLLLATQPGVRHIVFAMWVLKPGSQASNTVNHRLQEVGPVLHAVSKRPLLGYGPRTFGYGELTKVMTPHATLDDSYLGTLGSMGILGLGAIVLLLVRAYGTGWKAFAAAREQRDRVLVLGLIAVVEAWALMGGVADVYTFYAPPELFFVLLAALAAIRRGWPDEATS